GAAIRSSTSESHAPQTERQRYLTVSWRLSKAKDSRCIALSNVWESRQKNTTRAGQEEAPAATRNYKLETRSRARATTTSWPQASSWSQTWSQLTLQCWLASAWPHPHWRRWVAIQDISGMPRQSPEAPPSC